MGFISFNEKYYKQRLEAFEHKAMTSSDIYEAQQLLKVLDDLTDEGYTNLNDRMESDFSCLTRLRTVLKNNGATPFLIDHERLPGTSYNNEEHELEKLLGELIVESNDYSATFINPFLEEIRKYSDWIGYEEDTTYVFLLRDTLLPYVYYRNRDRKNIYPWLISRRFMEGITEIEYVDDDIRLPLYEALESGHIQFDDFSAYCKEKISLVLEDHPELKLILLELLSSIKTSKIMVVESGYMGTIPMLLKALDDRVDFRLFTTAPFLYEIYKDRIFCRRYEDIRKFETVYSQDLLLSYSSYQKGRFYVKMAREEVIISRSLAEMKMFIY